MTATGSVSTAQTATAAIYGYNTTRFTADPSSGGNVTIVGGSSNLSISTTFTGLSTSINNRTYYLGQTFTKGVSREIDKYSGNMIYVDHRPSITRSSIKKTSK